MTGASDSVVFATLEGLVNKAQPRIYAYNNDGEGQYGWLTPFGLGYNVVSDKYSLITKYRSSISGLVVYDDAQPDTINLATTIASVKGAIACAP